MQIVFFHRNKKAGYSIDKVTQTIVRGILDKKEYYVPYLGGSPIIMLKNIYYVWRNRNKNGINHITGDILYCMVALIGCKSVLTIHDTFGLDYQKRSFPKSYIALWLWLKIPMRIATKVVCISEDTRKNLYKVTKRRDFLVIHNAVDPIFKRSPKEYIHEKPIVLLIGTGEHKNLNRTFEALKGIKCSLTIIGELSDIQKKCLKDNGIDYINKTGLSDAQIVEEYVNSDIVSFISLFEGFGMIVIEANMVGRPVICSNIDVLHEVADDAALFVDPMNVASMREGFLKLFSDEELRKSLVNRGYENVKRFDVDFIRQKWIRLYTELC
jgi:glycosyltransferase involved in cell wall biosynthesis